MYRFVINRWARRGVIASLAAAVLLLVILFSVPLLVRSPSVRTWFQNELSARTGAVVQLGAVRFSFPLGITAEEVQIARTDLYSLHSERLTISVNPLDLPSQTIGSLELINPLLHIDLENLMKSPQQSSNKIALRRLNVHQGTVVLKINATTTIDLPNIDVTAENLNLGEGAGIVLRTDVPSLSSAADIAIKGALRELHVAVNLLPKPTTGLLQRDTGDSKKNLRINAVLHAAENQQPSIDVDAESQDFNLAGRSVTARLNSRIDIDSAAKAFNFSGQGQLANFPQAVLPYLKAVRTGPADISATGRFESATKLLTVSALEVKSQFGSSQAHGRFTVGDKVIINEAQTALREISWEALKPLLPKPLSDWAYQGSAEADLDLRGPLDTPEITGVARSPALTLRGGEFTLGPVSLNVPVQASSSFFQLKDFRAQGKNFVWKNAARETRADQIAIQGTLDSRSNAPMTFAGRVQLGAARLQTSAAMQTTAEQIAIETKLNYQQGQPLNADGQLQITGGKFSSVDNSRVGEKVALSSGFQLVIPPKQDRISLTTRTNVDAGEVLLGKYFGDLKTQKPVLEITGDYWPNEDRLDCRRCDVTIAGVGQIMAQGAIDRLTQTPNLRIQARSENFLPGGFFEIFLRETYKREYPALDKIVVNGQLAFQLQAQGPLEGLNLAGNLALKNGDVRSVSGDWQLGGVTLNLPLQLRLVGAEVNTKTAAKNGVLSIQAARFGAYAVAPLTTAISLSNNTLRFPQPIRIGIFGGTIEFSNLVWPDIVLFPKQLSLSARAERAQLTDLTQALGWPSFSGTLTAVIPQVQSSADILRTVGEIRADVFGGRVQMTKLEVENPFSALASTKIDATLSNINLEQASKTFEFGRISGTLEGSITDLVMTSGQASQFRADVHSVDRGTEQRISVEALNKITVLSSGQSGGVVYGGLAGLFDSFRYGKLGFKATLKNDRLSLRGVESRDGKEYLVVGTLLPPTVNIISHTQEISFGELLRRLQQIKNSDKAQVK